MKQIKSVIQTSQTIRTTTFITLLMIGMLTLAFISVPSFARDGRDSTLRERYEALIERYRQNDSDDTSTQTQEQVPAAQPSSQQPTESTPVQTSQPAQTQTSVQPQTTEPVAAEATSTEQQPVASNTATLAASRTGDTPITPYVSDASAKAAASSASFDSQLTGILIGALLIVIAQAGPFISKFASAKYQQRTATVR